MGAKGVSGTHIKAHVFVVDGDARILGWLVGFLSEKGYVVHGCTDVRALARVWKPVFPQCVLFALDARGDGLQVLEWLRERSQDVPVLGLASGVSVRTIVDAMRLGADNVLEKPVSERELLQVLQEVLEGGREQRRSQAEKMLARLSPREREVLDLVTQGLTSKQIAQRMGLSKKTVDVHRGKLLRKLEADSVIDLVRIHARRRGGTNFL